MADLTIAVDLVGRDTGLSSAATAARRSVGGLGEALGGIGRIASGVIVGSGIAQLPGMLIDASKAAAEDAASLSRLQQAVQNTGARFEDYAESLDKTINTGIRKGFADDQQRAALALLTAQTGSAEEAQSRLGLAMDLSRGANIDLSTAAKLLGRVTDENVNVLSRYGISVEKGTTSTELFGLVQERFGGQSEAFAESTAGAMASVELQMGELQETIGTALLPIMARLATFAANNLTPIVQRVLVPAVERLADIFEQVASFVDNNLQPVLEQLNPVFDFIARNLVTIVVPAFVLWAAQATIAAAATIGAMLPILIPLAAVTAAVLLLKTAWEGNWGDIQGKTAAVWEFLSTVVFPPLQAFFELLTTVILPALMTGWTTTWSQLQERAGATWAFLNEFVFQPLGAAFTLLTEVIIPAIREKWETDWQAMSDSLNTIWIFLRDHIFGPLGAMYNTIRNEWLPNLSLAWTTNWTSIRDDTNTFTGNVTGFVQTMRDNIGGAWDTIKSNTEQQVNGIASFLSTTWDTINRQAGEWWTMIKDTIWGAISPLVDLIRGAVEQIQGFLNSIKVPDIRLPTFQGVAAAAGQAAGTALSAPLRPGGKPGETQSEVENFLRNTRGGGDLPPEGAWLRPLSGYGVAQEYGRTPFAASRPDIYPGGVHTGIDLGAALGADVFAAQAGRVVSAGWDTSGFGNLVKLTHAGGISSLYAHLSGIGVSTGQTVRAGQHIGDVGSTGKSTGAHLHFELQRAGAHFNPRQLVGFARGVRDFEGGWAVVGERGWEMVRLPRGADVYSNEESRQMIGTGAQPVIVHSYLVVDGEVLARSVRASNRRYVDHNSGLDAIGGVA